ncbi:MAG: FAD-dependent oxidoreductase [Tistlia sp.]|uniref:NAD(P)/FAD-dependent oxidoreductase n=1 Tax=Tistlia sp. TaxID=3057121 RepID=UPI0034A1C9FC
MTEVVETDICVIGAGSAGLSVAAGAVQMGARVVLIERGPMGGDCLNFGCVPSKSLIAAAQAAHTFRSAGRFGIAAAEPQVDPLALRAHVRGVIAAIAPNDSVERFEGLGVRVVRAEAHFAGPREVVAGGLSIRARRFVVATGSRPAAPPIPGLAEVPYLTNESVFELAVRPEHLIVLGGGPIGCELAQAHRRLGARVTVLEAARILGKDDPEVTAVAKARLAAEGVVLREGVAVAAVAHEGGRFRLRLGEGADAELLEGSHLLVAAGRRPNLEGLNLAAAGIACSRQGIEVDAGLRSSNRRVFAIGDVAGGPQFTHVAGYHAGIVIRRALFRLPARVDYRALPWVTYTDPEVAHVGMTEAQARDRLGDGVQALAWPFSENDRAQAEHETEGLIKVVLDRRARVVGASIVGARAGELLAPWVRGVGQHLPIGRIAGAIFPYPTLSEVSKRVAGSYYSPKLFSRRTKTVVRWLLKLG